MAADGSALWRLARESAVLDTNSPYAYVLWCTDFADTSVVVRSDGEPIAFITGYWRPSGELMIWQVAVDEAWRCKGLATTMLNWLVQQASDDAGNLPIVEATVASTNMASLMLFARFARERSMVLVEAEGFGRHLFPDGHEPEPRLRLIPKSSMGAN